ncbi:MAG TPA: YkgJ family cysteine cluster protein [Puia sp.]|nr:YkgJ family cysteine cluster protein [Puia sp.]
MNTQSLNISAFRRIASRNRRRFRKLLSTLEKLPFRGLDKFVVAADKEVWKEVSCLSCANCCKTMSPTYTLRDIRRIAKYVNLSEKEFRAKWLTKDKAGDWINQRIPCQFLDLQTNMCSIYSVRPKDCAGFPHHTKKKMVDYMHVYRQNIDYCPATYRLVEKIYKKVNIS